MSERLLPVIKKAIARRLIPLARANGRDPSPDRDDFVGGVWLHLLDNQWSVLRNYDPSRGSLEGYISTIADRYVIGVFRIRSRNPYNDLPMEASEIGAHLPPASNLERRARAREELEDLYEFLQLRLGQRGLLLFQMLEVDELSIPEVCERAEMSRDALYQWRARFRRLVRDWRDRQ